MSNILNREIITLTEHQNKMITSGWGSDVLEKTVVEKITYLSDGLKVKGYIAYPTDDSKKYPSIVWCRGGYGNAGAIDKFTARGMFGQLASWGYCVFATQYRGNDGSEGHDDFGGDDVNDVLNLIPLSDEIPQADKSIWGIEGWSRGGMMTYLTLTRTNIFKAAIVLGGIANLRCNAEESKFMRRLYEHTLGKCSEEEFKQRCEQRSVINFSEKLSKETPMLLIHGNADERVLPHDSIDLSYKLLEHKIPFRLVMLEGGDHFLKSHRKEVDEMKKKWFARFLKGV
ncbi:MAG: prolyl oligopeptidase family serine peptidase [Ignavibacterium album]|uniref:alpha/beta hydrolase family protein n=1 Tax=Ignavibacterium album TaxID=591197 RepID=UPI0026EECCEB|nr:prolyl oligopeptidase family serine peptidase [Ignavibacterium album]MCX8106383.1 prolyl oligopeptidase family serine peptidase [Ignavibacterium album]